MGGSDESILSSSSSSSSSSTSSQLSSPKSPGDSKFISTSDMTSIIIPVEQSHTPQTIINTGGITTPGSDTSQTTSSSLSSSSTSSPLSQLAEEKTDEGELSQQEGHPHARHTDIHSLLKKDSIYQMTKEEEELMERVGKGLKEGEVASQCLWVGNVDPEISQTEFKSVFEKYGPVQLIRLFPRSKCAFVTFQKPSHAIKALEMEGKQLGSMMLTLNVGKASRHLWVGNVGPNMSDAELQAAFAKFGTVESVRVLRANQCAFVNFSTDVEALRAAEEMNGTELGGQTIVINFQWSNSYKRPGKGKNGSPEGGPQSHNRTGSTGSMNGTTNGQQRKSGSPGSRSPERKPKTLGTAHPPSRQLFVGNIVPNVTEETLWALFSRFGELEQIKGFSGRGYAFVIYRSLRVAVWVRDQMTMYPPILGGRPLCVNFGKPPQDSPHGGTDDYVGDGLSMPMMSQSMVPITGLSPEMGYSTLYTPPNETYSPELAYRSGYMTQPTTDDEYSEMAMQMNAMNLGMMGLSPHMYIPSSHSIMVDAAQQPPPQQQQQQQTNDTNDGSYLSAQYQQAAAQQQQAAAAAAAAAAAQQYAMQQQVSPYGSPYQQYAHLAFSPLPTLSPMLSPHHLLQMQQLQQMSSPQLSHRELVHSSPLSTQQTNRLAMLQAAALANTGMTASSHSHGIKAKKSSLSNGTPAAAAAAVVAGPD